MLNKPIYVHLTDSAYDIEALLPQTALKTTPQKPKQSPARMTLGLARMIFPFSTSVYSLAQTTDKCNSLGDASLISQMVITATPNRGQHADNTAAKQIIESRLLINV
jgi:hypothetical protein